jgi:cellulose synthase/poly-beta-1,6-N-acetylglucosamine synthase-like glycosyltransferase
MTASPARPRVTIVVIFLNAAAYLAEALDSALAQTFRDFEIILVDDGSNDGSTNLRGGMRASIRPKCATWSILGTSIRV